MVVHAEGIDFLGSGQLLYTSLFAYFDRFLLKMHSIHHVSGRVEQYDICFCLSVFACLSRFPFVTFTDKAEGFPYSIPGFKAVADHIVQVVSPQVSHPSRGRLSLLLARPLVTAAAQHHCHVAGTKLYCLGTQAHVV